MTQRIICDRPPMFDEIDAAFKVAGRPVIFSWGDVIYNPMSIDIPPALLAHEAVHGERQKRAGVEAWWRQYIASPAFRIAEEIPAHQAEYRKAVEIENNRSGRRRHLAGIARRLSGPLYGRVISLGEAKTLLREAA